jgi:hypothetical protein
MGGSIEHVFMYGRGDAPEIGVGMTWGINMVRFLRDNDYRQSIIYGNKLSDKMC